MYIVTGGAGFIGSALVWQLNEQGIDDILVVDQLSDGPKWKNLAKRQVTTIIHKSELFDWLTEHGDRVRIEGIFHMGASSSTVEMDGDYLMANNLNYSIALWDYCTREQIPFIYASSASTYGDGEAGFDDSDAGTNKLVPMHPYGFSKHKFDAFVMKQDRCPPFWAGLKFFNVYGPGEYHKGGQSSVIFQFVPQVQETGTIKLFKSHNKDYADGGQKRDFVYVKDCTRVMTHLMFSADAQSGVYNVGTGKARTFEDLAKAVFAAMKKKENIELIDMPEKLRSQYQYFTEANLERLKSRGGYKDKFFDLESGVKDYVVNYLLKDDPYL